MPRYHFSTTSGSTETRDDTGFDCDDVDAAKAKAEAILDALVRAEPDTGHVVEVRNAAGTILYSGMVMRG